MDYFNVVAGVSMLDPYFYYSMEPSVVQLVSSKTRLMILKKHRIGDVRGGVLTRMISGKQETSLPPP